MPFLLDHEHVQSLLSQPESGMGYQIVEAAFRNSFSSTHGFVLNAEVFIPDDRMEKILGPRHLSYAKILQEAERPQNLFKSFTVIRRTSLQEKAFSMNTKGSSALQAAPTLVLKGEIYRRFSAYQNDRRITRMKGLLPETYATTDDDAKQVRTGTEAILRYALPNDEPAIHIFKIEPPERTLLRIGIVQPNYGKPGGGVEVFFEKGSPDGTVTGVDKIPAK
jgi:hypothetical protein